MQGYHLAFLIGLNVALAFVNVTHSYFHPYYNIHKDDDKFTIQTDKGSYPGAKPGHSGFTESDGTYHPYSSVKNVIILCERSNDIQPE